MQKIISVLLPVVAFMSCTKTITPALNTAPTQLVIQGAISDTAGPYYVSVLNSVGFYASNSYPGVSGANITITDSMSGLRDVLTETTTGYYITHTLVQGIYGHTYILNVSLNGKTYTSSSTMPQPVVLDSVTFDNTTKNTIRAQANYQDPKGVVNFYKYSLVINGVFDKRFQVFEDRLSDGRYIQDKVDADTSEIKHNDLVQLSLVGIDKHVYTYLNEAEGIAYNNNNLAAPATPTSNISGGCMGYFSAQTVSSKKRVVKF
jgi:hypothetical protein